MTVVIVNMITLSLMMLQIGVNFKEKKVKLFSSFHLAELTEIQVINKNIKRLNRKTIY